MNRKEEKEEKRRKIEKKRSEGREVGWRMKGREKGEEERVVERDMNEEEMQLETERSVQEAIEALVAMVEEGETNERGKEKDVAQKKSQHKVVSAESVIKKSDAPSSRTSIKRTKIFTAADFKNAKTMDAIISKLQREMENLLQEEIDSLSENQSDPDEDSDPPLSTKH